MTAFKFELQRFAEVMVGKSGGDSLTVSENDDILIGTSGTDTFVYTGGNDVIINYSGEDTVQIKSGKIDGYSFDGSDLIFNIGNGSLRLKNMTNHAITVKDSTGKTTTKIYGTGYSGHEVIKNLVKAWTQTLLPNKSIEKLDESIKLCSNFNNIQEVIDKIISDCRKSDNAEIFLRDYCGIIFDNGDTGAITGWNAGGLKIKKGSEIIGETILSVKHVPNYADTTFKTSQGVSINISSTGDSLTADDKKVFDGVYSWWAEEAIGLIEESYGVNFNDGDKINFFLTLDASYWGHTSNGRDVTINMNKTNFKSTDDYNGNGVDRTIAHEFTHIAQNLFMGRFPKFLQEGFADLTCGVDDRSSKYRNIEILTGDADSLSNYFNLTNYENGDSYCYAAGYIFYRYLAKQAADSYDSSKSYSWKDNSYIKGTSKGELLTGSGTNVTIAAGAGNDTLTVYGENMKVLGESGNDYILISSLASGASIDGGRGEFGDAQHQRNVGRR